DAQPFVRRPRGATADDGGAPPAGVGTAHLAAGADGGDGGRGADERVPGGRGGRGGDGPAHESRLRRRDRGGGDRQRGGALDGGGAGGAAGVERVPGDGGARRRNPLDGGRHAAGGVRPAGAGVLPSARVTPPRLVSGLAATRSLRSGARWVQRAPLRRLRVAA